MTRSALPRQTAMAPHRGSSRCRRAGCLRISLATMTWAPAAGPPAPGSRGRMARGRGWTPRPDEAWDGQWKRGRAAGEGLDLAAAGSFRTAPGHLEPPRRPPPPADAGEVLPTPLRRPRGPTRPPSAPAAWGGSADRDGVPVMPGPAEGGNAPAAGGAAGAAGRRGVKPARGEARGPLLLPGSSRSGLESEGHDVAVPFPEALHVVCTTYMIGGASTLPTSAMV